MLNSAKVLRQLEHTEHNTQHIISSHCMQEHAALTSLGPVYDRSGLDKREGCRSVLAGLYPEIFCQDGDF